MKWLSNIYDPRRPDARSWQGFQDWLKDKVILQPQATDSHTVEELAGETDDTDKKV